MQEKIIKELRQELKKVIKENDGLQTKLNLIQHIVELYEIDNEKENKFLQKLKEIINE